MTKTPDDDGEEAGPRPDSPPEWDPEDDAGDRSFSDSGPKAEPAPPKKGDTVLRRYRLERLIGRGGMGEVWQATDTVLGRHVAVKMVSSTCLSQAGCVVKTLKREAVAVARLDHPAIVAVHDFGMDRDDGRWCVVMQYVEGRDLAEFLRSLPDRRMTLPETLAMARQVADGLAHARRHGVSHRDLKPANLMKMPDGRVRILDFGLAGTGGLVSTVVAGVPLGTPVYMSPEQVLGEKPVDHRADMCSLGIVVYECLEGRRPFDAPDKRGQYALQISALLPQPARWPSGPGAAETLELVRRMTSKHRERRPAEWEEVVAGLDAALMLCLSAGNAGAPASAMAAVFTRLMAGACAAGGSGGSAGSGGSMGSAARPLPDPLGATDLSPAAAVRLAAVLLAELRDPTTPAESLRRTWNGRIAEVWTAAGAEAYETLARRLIAAGEPGDALEVLAEALSAPALAAPRTPSLAGLGSDTDPAAAPPPPSLASKDPRLRHLAALALARMGASDAALCLLEELNRDGVSDGETLGLGARVHKDLARAAAARGDSVASDGHRAKARNLYDFAYHKATGENRLSEACYVGINSATLAFLTGDGAASRERAAAIRSQAIQWFDRTAETDPDRYWALATLGEAEMLLGNRAAAGEAYTAARAAGWGRLGDLASTLSQARTLAAALDSAAPCPPVGPRWIDELWLRPLSVAVVGASGPGPVPAPVDVAVAVIDGSPASLAAAEDAARHAAELQLAVAADAGDSSAGAMPGVAAADSERWAALLRRSVCTIWATGEPAPPAADGQPVPAPGTRAGTSPDTRIWPTAHVRRATAAAIARGMARLRADELIAVVSETPESDTSTPPGPSDGASPPWRLGAVIAVELASHPSPGQPSATPDTHAGADHPHWIAVAETLHRHTGPAPRATLLQRDFDGRRLVLVAADPPAALVLARALAALPCRPRVACDAGPFRLIDDPVLGIARWAGPAQARHPADDPAGGFRPSPRCLALGAVPPPAPAPA